MKNKILFYEIIAVLIVVALIIFVWCSSKITDDYQVLDLTDTLVPAQTNCGIESCHGLEITCGADVPEVCTMEYRGGDGCRQFAGCEIIEGNCRVKKSIEFDKCKGCVEKCELENNDPVNFFNCEANCFGENPELIEF